MIPRPGQQRHQIGTAPCCRCYSARSVSSLCLTWSSHSLCCFTRHAQHSHVCCLFRLQLALADPNSTNERDHISAACCEPRLVQHCLVGEGISVVNAAQLKLWWTGLELVSPILEPREVGPVLHHSLSGLVALGAAADTSAGYSRSANSEWFQVLTVNVGANSEWFQVSCACRSWYQRSLGGYPQAHCCGSELTGAASGPRSATGTHVSFKSRKHSKMNDAGCCSNPVGLLRVLHLYEATRGPVVHPDRGARVCSTTSPECCARQACSCLEDSVRLSVFSSCFAELSMLQQPCAGNNGDY